MAYESPLSWIPGLLDRLSYSAGGRFINIARYPGYGFVATVSMHMLLRSFDIYSLL